MSKLWQLIRFNLVGIVAAAVSTVIAIGLGVYSFTGFSTPATNSVPLLNNSLIPSTDNIDKISSPDNFNVDQSTVNGLVIEEGLDQDTATLVSQINTQFKTSDSTHLNYEQNFSDKAAWDAQITVIPDQTYFPTDVELATAAATGNEIYDSSITFKEIDGVPQFTLRYFVPYEAMSDELKTTIQSSGSLSTTATPVGFLPRAEATGGATGAVFETIVKGLLREGVSKLGDFSNLFSALDAATGAYKLSQSKFYFSELDQLRQCAENPTNPLTKKMYQENPSEKAKVIDQINEAQSQLNQLTTARMLNLAAKTGSKFTGANFAGKLFFDSVAKWNDETLKEVAEGWIDDAKKGVVGCEPAQIRLNGSIQYHTAKSWASTLYEPCMDPGKECYTVKEERSGSGNFFLTTRGTVITGNGSGTFEHTRNKVITKPPSDPLTEYGGEYDFVQSGDVQIIVEGATSPTVRVSVNGAAMLTEEGSSTNYVLHYGDSKVTAVTEAIHRDTTGGFVCYFEDVDLLKGGTYEQDVAEGEDVIGTCKLELLPEN